MELGALKMKFKDLKLKSKLEINVGLLILFFIIFASVTFFSLFRTQTLFKEVKNNSVPDIVAILELKSISKRLFAEIQGYVATGDQHEIIEFNGALSRFDAWLDRWSIKKNDVEEQRLKERMAIHKRYFETAGLKVFNHYELKNSLLENLQKTGKEFERAYLKYSDNLSKEDRVLFLENITFQSKSIENKMLWHLLYLDIQGEEIHKKITEELTELSKRLTKVAEPAAKQKISVLLNELIFTSNELIRVKQELSELLENVENYEDTILSTVSKSTALQKSEVDEAFFKARRSIQQNFFIIASIGILFVVLALFVSQFVSKSILNPINDLLIATSKVANGTFSHRIKNIAADEIGELESAFNKMASHLEETTVLKDYFDSIIQSINDSLLVLATDGTIKMANASACRLLGYDLHEITKLSVEQILLEEDPQEKFQDKSLQVIFTKGIIKEIEKDFVTKTGDRIPILFSGSIMRNTKDETQEIICVATNISKLKLAQKELETSYQKLEQTQKHLTQSEKLASIGTLAGGIAHDFNNILAAIMGFSQLALAQAEQGSSLQKDINEVLKASNRAKDLIWQVLTFARQTEEEIHPIRIRTLIKEVLQFVRSTTPASVEIQHDLDSKSVIMGNPTQLHQILMNLCTNAIQAMQNDTGILKIRLKDTTITSGSSILESGLKSGKYIELSVSDTGSGISPTIINAIFDPYFTTKAMGEGTGLGLSVVHGIVEKHEGKITVESTLDKGSVFTIYLPVCHIDEIYKDTKNNQMHTGAERILFVDDEDILAKMSKRTLESFGYSVTTRTSSVEALELFRTKPDDFDLVITDMTMPKMTGDKLAVKLMEIRKEIPVILCTGFSKSISEEDALNMGIKAFVYKPIVNEALAKTIHKVLGKD